MKLRNWFKNKMMGLALALSRVEKNALSSEGISLSDDTEQVQRHKMGYLSDDLMQGRITEEVKLLRHRMYKILDESSKVKAKFHRDADGKITYELINRTLVSSKLTGDPFDDYKIEMVVDNSPICEGFGLENKSEHPDDANVDKQIICERDGITPSFEIETYTTKLFVRFIKDDERLLEFHIPKYADHYHRSTFLLISELKKILEKQKRSDILDIKSIAFITFNAIGCQDFREFIYNVSNFDKIVEYEGNYILKFKAKVIVNGDNIIDKYRHEEQEKRYENKERRV